MHRLEESHRPEAGVAPVEPGPELRQRRRMLAALAMLLLALILVVARNRQYLYPAAAVSDSDTAAQTSSPPQPAKPEVAVNAPPTAPVVETPAAKPRERHRVPPVKATQLAPAPPVVASDRAVLPALQVEVVAGDSHRTVQPGSNSIKVEMQPGSPVTDRLPGDAEASPSSPSVDAAERVRLSPDASQLVTHQVSPEYPLLAKQMKVQGAVILQALIGKEGTIQDLQVLSGPSILSSAAREAVKQWRFKPYYQSGQAVETQAKITVNFTISTY